MNLAFCLFNYYPYGGLEQSFLNIAKQAVAHEHNVDVFTGSWEGDVPPGLNVNIVPCNAWSNHASSKKFVTRLQNMLAFRRYDCVVGFNRMPGLDVYYNADVSFVVQARKKHGLLYRLAPRYRVFAGFEYAVFSTASATHILYISPRVKTEYQTEYKTAESRWHALPPGINKQRIEQALESEDSAAVRNSLNVGQDDILLLMVGSDFHRKGVDRALHALAALPQLVRAQTTLVVIGKGDDETIMQLAHRLAVADRVRLPGPRDDVPRFLAAADMLLHPARTETAGNAILEGLVAGLPVLVTESCGFSFHVLAAKAGLVIADEPYEQGQFNTLLNSAISSERRQQWKINALRYAEATDLYSRPLRAVEIIETLVASRQTATAG